MAKPDLTSCARAVIDQEIKGLAALKETLDGAFSTVVNLALQLKGRLIVTGMGKSGHIARKIAATLASTGTPAYFVHPAEASHGDLGMIAKGDAILALSNSGETPELADMVAYAKRYSIPLIAMVGRAPSSLADAADHVLKLPDVPEASPMQAPTTSTAMMLALGDAIAIALLEARGFTREEFATFHPGGKLGKALLRVHDLMHTGDELPLVAAVTPMPEVLLTMTAKRFGCAGVLEAARLVGVITDGDLRRHMGDNLLNCSAAEVMTGAPKTIKPGALAAEALAVMNEKSITSLFAVEDNGTPAGIIHIHDCLRAGVV